jgi:peptidoglycan hydrolase-like protein with peptidoglycan-binding domain
LLNRGYDIGEVDGLIGAKSREAISEFQKTSGLTVNGRAGQQVLKALRVPVSTRPPKVGG